jgi:hypothetical protein
MVEGVVPSSAEHSGHEIIGSCKVEQQADSRCSTARCGGRSARVNWTAGAAVHIHIRAATGFVFDRRNKVAGENWR